ncbi:hypothetical protein EMIHUDRAFT_455483, partial [Emiliania huxleyi CCMP1516]|uniref:Uncharacterized protein n=2 Tax=Emiliania huxleyi TaxID=2903 RepID=A0A0D3KGI3_EMIH1
ARRRSAGRDRGGGREAPRGGGGARDGAPPGALPGRERVAPRLRRGGGAGGRRRGGRGADSAHQGAGGGGAAGGRGAAAAQPDARPAGARHPGRTHELRKPGVCPVAAARRAGRLRRRGRRADGDSLPHRVRPRRLCESADPAAGRRVPSDPASVRGRRRRAVRPFDGVGHAAGHGGAVWALHRVRLARRGCGRLGKRRDAIRPFRALAAVTAGAVRPKRGTFAQASSVSSRGGEGVGGGDPLAGGGAGLYEED